MEIDKETNMNEYIPPPIYKEKIHVLQEKLPPILEEFKKYFVFYNKNPEYQEYQQIFENIKGNINNLNTSLFSISNDIQKNTDNLNRDLIKFNHLIIKEREKNKELKKKLGIVENRNNASEELIDDYREIYNYNYLRNWGLSISILISLSFISNVYKNKLA